MRNFHGITRNWTPAAETDLPAREIRRAVQLFNDSFGSDDEHTEYILSGMAGYRITRDLGEIRAAIERDERLIKKRLKAVIRRKRRLELLEMKRWTNGGLL